MTLLLDCDSIERWSAGPASDPTKWGTVELDTVNYVQGIGSVKAVVKSGVYDAYFEYQRPYGNWWDLRNEPILKILLNPSEISDRRQVQLLIATAEPDGTGYVSYDYGVALNLIPGQFNTVEADLRQDINGASPNLSMVRTITLIYKIHGDNASPTLNVDAIESLEGEPLPPEPLTVNVLPIEDIIYVNGTMSFAAMPNGGTQPYTYQWYDMLDNPIVDAIEQTLAITVTDIGTYQYYVKITDAVGQEAISNFVTLQVIERPPPSTNMKLRAQGNRLVDAAGKTVQLVGYAGGVQTMSPSPAGLWERRGNTQHYDWVFDEQAIIDNLDAMRAAGANCIRVHMAMWWLKHDGEYLGRQGIEYLTFKENFYRIIQLAKERGIYVIIDGMTVTPDFLGGGGQDALPYPPYQDDEPDQTLAQDTVGNAQEFIDLWLQLALYLKDLPNLILEPWNEPHTPSGHDESTVRAKWFDVVHNFVVALRTNGVDHPIVIHWGYGSYINWNYPEDPAGMMFVDIDTVNATINDPLQNLIYSTHLYRTGGAFGIYSLGQARQNYNDVKAALENHLIYTHSHKYPVLIGEIGASTTRDPENESLALQNALQILSSWGVGWLVYWWRLESEWTLFAGNVWIPLFNENGQLVKNAMVSLIPPTPKPSTIPILALVGVAFILLTSN